MNSRGSGTRLEEFFNGKGFYIVLFLCAAVIGVSAWMMAGGEGAMESEISVMKQDESERVETVVIPPMQPIESAPPVLAAPEEEMTEEAEAPVPIEAAAPAWSEDAEPAVYIRPLEGEIERPYSVTALAYDVTMRDWRTHDGVDIAAPLGSPVTAAHEGMIAAVYRDDLLGTVVAVDHGDGSVALYANLADTPAVKAGDWVDAGATLGAVGTTALGEIGQPTHLHFAMTQDGVTIDPTDYIQ